jgi:hypothetical protein
MFRTTMRLTERPRPRSRPLAISGDSSLPSSIGFETPRTMAMRNASRAIPPMSRFMRSVNASPRLCAVWTSNGVIQTYMMEMDSQSRLFRSSRATTARYVSHALRGRKCSTVPGTSGVPPCSLVDQAERLATERAKLEHALAALASREEDVRAGWRTLAASIPGQTTDLPFEDGTTVPARKPSEPHHGIVAFVPPDDWPSWFHDCARAAQTLYATHEETTA